MTSDDKLNAIQGRRKPLLHEQFGAKLDVKIAEEARDENLITEPQARLEEVNAKLKALDEVEAEVKAEAAPESHDGDNVLAPDE